MNRAESKGAAWSRSNRFAGDSAGCAPGVAFLATGAPGTRGPPAPKCSVLRALALVIQSYVPAGAAHAAGAWWPGRSQIGCIY